MSSPCGCDQDKPIMKVYIASPYTKGDPAANVRAQIDAAHEIMDARMFPFAPLMAHFHHLVHPRSWGDWMKIDIVWLMSCDCVLRLPGESQGADYEVQVALGREMPVYYSIEELFKEMGI